MSKYKTYQLLPIKENCELDLPHFPTRMQAFIFRAWETVSAKILAKVLRTTEENVTELAQSMGLPEQRNIDEWRDKGYITIIKSLWHILPYEQLCEVLDWDEEKLAYTIKEDDFLNVKLGFFKPACEPIYYTPLTEEEKKKTKKIKETITECIAECAEEKEKLPFDFINDIYPKKTIKTANDADFDVVIDNSWSVEYNGDISEVKSAIELFCECYNEDWQINFNGSGSKKITINVIDEKEEYHKVVITKSGIEISAEKSGVLRALMMLVDKAREVSGPCYNEATYEMEATFHTRFLYSYCGLYGQAFDFPWEVSYPEKILKEYAKMGINGIWTQAVLYKMVEFPFDPSVSVGWESRLENLKGLIKAAKKYGIKVYLYLNEPRSMPVSFFEKYPDMKGHEFSDGREGYASICTSSERGRQYLHDAVYKLCKSADGLGGFFLITRGENMTNCYSKAFDSTKINCPRCSEKEPYEVLAENYKIIIDAIKSANPDLRVISWPWGWFGAGFEQFSATEKCISLIPKESPIIAVSENEKDLCIGGVENIVRDYSMAHYGPSESTLRIWNTAKKYGHEIFAKVQVNTTWECSPVPSLPVYQFIINHLENLKKENITGIMLGWTLGGYPSANLKVASGSFFIDKKNKQKNHYETALRSIYQEDYDKVKEATDIFCEAFVNFPFQHAALYNGPHNAGPSNLLYGKPTGYKATMTCYCYDDLDGWRQNYPEEIYEDQYRKISETWEKGLELIKDMDISEFRDVAFSGYALFKSSYNQVKFVRTRNEFLNGKNREEAKAILCDIASQEKDIAKMVYRIMRRNPSIGYEAANHYYFNRTMLLEKLINCDYIVEQFGETAIDN